MTAKLVGINHVALEVSDLERSLAFYGSLFEFACAVVPPVRRSSTSATSSGADAGPVAAARTAPVTSASSSTTRRLPRAALAEAGAEIFPGRRLDFLDPDGNRIEIVQYDQVQFTKSPEVLRGMGLELGKTEEALAELREKGCSSV